MLCSDIGWLTGGSPRKFRKIHAGLLERVQVAEQVPWWGYVTSVAGAGVVVLQNASRRHVQ